MVPLEKEKKWLKVLKIQLEVECGHMIIFEKAFEMREIVITQKIIWKILRLQIHGLMMLLSSNGKN